METELKLLVDPADIAALRNYSLLNEQAPDQPHQQTLESTYFDTPDLYLRRHGASLRVRHIVGEGWVQTLKGSDSGSAGLYRRDEWETPLREPYPELTTLARMVRHDRRWARILSAGALSKKLVPLFTTRVERTTWALRLAHGDNIELALDQGKVEHDALQEPINEIEVELKTGNPANLFDFALELQNSVPIRIGNVSKAERGFSLCVPQPPAVVKAGQVELTASMNVEQGLQAILVNCLEQIEGNAAGVVQGDDPEHVHQMRVGLRRLHSALGLHQKIAPCPEALSTDFKWLREQLGAARDWEVLAGNTLPSLIEKFSDRLEFLQMQKAATTIAREKRKSAAIALDSPQYTRLLLSFTSWVQGAKWRESASKAQLDVLVSPLEKFARTTIAGRRRKLLERGKNLPALDPARRHQARIAAKRLRYAMTFYASLYRPRKVKPFIAVLSALQDSLGELNDVRVASTLFPQIIAAQPDLAEPSGFAQGYFSAHAEATLAKLGKEWKHFRQTPVPN